MAAVARVALITGAARGIGLAIAQWFDAHDWRVVLLDIDDDQLQRTFAQWPHRERAQLQPCHAPFVQQHARMLTPVRGRARGAISSIV